MKMKSLFLFIILFLLMIWFGYEMNKPDFQGEILKVKKSSIIVETDNVNPDASYRTYEVRVNKNTEIEGNVTSFSELKSHQKVKIWFENNRSNQMIDNQLASKVIVNKN